MTCERYEAGLVDLARGSLDDAAAEASVRGHLGGCPSCAARYDRERQLTEGLRSLSAATVVPANDLAERRLAAAFAAANGARRQAIERRVAVRWMAWAAAACFLFLLGAWAAVEWRTRTAAPVGTAAPVQASATPPAVEERAVEPVESPAPAPAPIVNVAGSSPGARVVPAVRRAALQQEPDRFAGFVPLPAAQGLPGFDSGMIVRVSIPTASLPAYGLAITPESANVVNADLLVGQDGQARAIRLVSLVGGSRR